MKGPSLVPREPGANLGMFVGGIVIDNGVDQLAGRHFALNSVQEADELRWRWRCMQRPMTLPFSVLRAANSEVDPENRTGD